MFGSGGADSFNGESGNDTMSGAGGDDQLAGNEGHDIINGGSGNDYISAGVGDDTIDGGEGWDVLSYVFEATASTSISPTSGISATFTSFGTGTVIDWNGGVDGFTGIELVGGSRFDDVMTGSADSDEFDGYLGNDTMSGAGNDTMSGAGGDDRLSGNDGDDFINGGAGNDRLYGGAGADTIDGGDGFDRLNYRWDEDVTGGVEVTMSGEGEGTALDWSDATDSFINIEEIRGTIFDDTFVGSDATDKFKGEEGNDTISGGGDDELFGGDGDDLITAGAGDDYIQANAGADTVDGGDGWDFMSYEWDDASSGIEVTYNYETGGRIKDHSGATDNFTGIEGIAGTQLADTFTGNVGDDVFRGSAGDDIIDGGTGDDTALYNRDSSRGATRGVIVNLASGSAIDGFGNTDTIFRSRDVDLRQAADTALEPCIV